MNQVLSHGPAKATPSQRHLAILRLLAHGASDQVIARELCVSIRTMYRDLAELRELLGVTTRFELAHEATSRGWID